MSHELTKKAATRGWTAKEMAERWGMSSRNISYVMKAEKQMTVDAVNGLPERKYVQMFGRANRPTVILVDEAENLPDVVACENCSHVYEKGTKRCSQCGSENLS